MKEDINNDLNNILEVTVGDTTHVVHIHHYKTTEYGLWLEPEHDKWAFFPWSKIDKIQSTRVIDFD